MLSQQMQWHSAIPTLFLTPVLFTWTVLTVVAVNVISLTAHTAHLQTAPIARLLEWDVKVSLYALTAKFWYYWVQKNCIITFVDVFKHIWKCNAMVYNFIANKTLTWHLFLHKMEGQWKLLSHGWCGARIWSWDHSSMNHVILALLP